MFCRNVPSSAPSNASWEKRPALGPLEAGAGQGPEADANRGGGLKRKSQTKAAAARSEPSSLLELFDKIDHNRNGLVSKTELKKELRHNRALANSLHVKQKLSHRDHSKDEFDAVFDAIDADHDHAISRAEWAAFVERSAARPAAAANPKADADANAKTDAEQRAADELAKRKAAAAESNRKKAEDAARQRLAQEEAQRRKAEELAARKAALEEANRNKAEEASKKKEAEEEAKRQRAEAAKQRRAADDEAKQRKLDELAEKKRATEEASRRR